MHVHIIIIYSLRTGEMCVVEWLEHTCFVKNGKWDLNVTKGNTVEVQKLSREQKNKFC